jgi:ketosteroid isomerase-like protein
MSDRDEFFTTFLPQLVAAEAALHNGDLEPRLRLWTRSDPVTLFGALGPCNYGWAQVNSTFQWLAPLFLPCHDYRLDLVAADVSGDLAYTVGFERSVHDMEGGNSAERVLRATQVYRREGGQWRVVHRHGDIPPADSSPHAGTYPPVTTYIAPRTR